MSWCSVIYSLFGLHREICVLMRQRWEMHQPAAREPTVLLLRGLCWIAGTQGQSSFHLTRLCLLWRHLRLPVTSVRSHNTDWHVTHVHTHTHYFTPSSSHLVSMETSGKDPIRLFPSALNHENCANVLLNTRLLNDPQASPTGEPEDRGTPSSSVLSVCLVWVVPQPPKKNKRNM